jgi:hypothetical protein
MDEYTNEKDEDGNKIIHYFIHKSPFITNFGIKIFSFEILSSLFISLIQKFVLNFNDISEPWRHQYAINYDNQYVKIWQCIDDDARVLFNYYVKDTIVETIEEITA